MDISVIVPIYNVENFLKPCLDSILQQSFQGQFEIICVNDGSTDNSPEIVNEYSAKDKRVKLITQKNAGAGKARNNGLSHALGKYVMFMDSDDSLKHNHVLSILFKEMDDNDLDIVVADFEFDYLDKAKNRRMERSNIIKDRIMSGREFYDSGVRTKSISAVVWNKLYQKDFLVRHNISFLEGIIYEDVSHPERFTLLKESSTLMK